MATIELWSFSGPLKTSWNVSFSLDALESKEIWSGSINKMTSGLCDRNSCFVYLIATNENGELVSENSYIFDTLAHVTLSDPNFEVLSVTMQGSSRAVIEISASKPAPFTFLDTTLPGRFSDNGFLMLPGTKKITFFSWDNFAADQLFDTLTIKSVYDTLN